MSTTIVTGVSGGIGGAVAEQLLRDGHRIIGVDIAEPVEKIEGVEYLSADLSSEEGIAALLRGLDSIGVNEIDSLVHCAGVGQWSSLADTPRVEWERILRINLFGTIGITQALSPMIRDEGSVVLFGSGTAFKGPANMAIYVASKGGVIAFTRSLADELGFRAITVNVVCPGYTATPMVESIAHTESANIATRAIKRSAVPADIIGTVQFLISPQSRFVTGQAISVDGGSVRR